MDPTAVTIPHGDDFELTGDGAAAAWQAIPWLDLERVGGPAPYRTRCKQLRSATGLYLLVDCEDRRLDNTMQADGLDLFTEDVVEWFLQPDPAVPLYIEYELSPLGHHLVLLVPNAGKGFHGWTGWKVEGKRAVRRATAVRGGERAPGAAVTGWSAECFLPWSLFRGLGNIPLADGGTWRGNVYRIDYVGGKPTHWALFPATGNDFHKAAGFGTLRGG